MTTTQEYAEPLEIEKVENYIFSITQGIRYDGTPYFLVSENSPRMKYPKTYIFRDHKRALEYYNNIINNHKKHLEYKLEHKQKAKESKEILKQKIKTGTILYTSWGYEQTNVEFFEVLEIKGAVVTLREIMQDARETGFMSGQCVPIPGKYNEKEPAIKRRITAHGIKISNCTTAWLWDGTPCYYSYYG